MPQREDKRVAILRSGESRKRGYITAEMRHYSPREYEANDLEFILINHGVNDVMTKDQVISFAMGLLELTGVLESEKFIKEIKL